MLGSYWSPMMYGGGVSHSSPSSHDECNPIQMSPYYAGGLGIPYMSSMLPYGMGMSGMYGLGGMGYGMGGMGMGMGYPYGMMLSNPYGYSGMAGFP